MYTYGIYIWVIFSANLLMEKFMSGRLLLCWRHKLTYNVMRKRYLRSQEMQRTLHSEIVNLFFSEFNSNDSDEENGENKS